ncbi:MAG: patatin-like phospholipase family protein [Anaerolineae bacterium]|nr:patatin-like phospholipase family protein [Anaerolineae bacterium]
MSNPINFTHNNKQLVRPRAKTALVLAGGGLTGIVYELGALRAMNDLLVHHTVNDFDLYVGTSAGSLVAAGLANGIQPETMMQAIDSSAMRRDIMRFNTGEIVQRSLGLPKKTVQAWLHYLRNHKDMTMFDMLWFMLEGLPSAFYDSNAVDKYLEKMINQLGGENDFEKIAKELFIIATNLDTGERAVFSKYDEPKITVSQAVAASSAVPMMYKPVRIGDAEYVDGGLRGNASIDLAIEHGAKLIVCVNPLVPFNASQGEIPFLGPEGKGDKRQFLSEKGMQAIANQVFRTVSHSALHYHIKQLKRTHPEVDIILIEPRPDDYQMHFYNIMRFSARLIIARHGYESATLGLAADYPQYKDVLARHGIPLSRQFVIEELTTIQESGYDLEVVRDLLEKRPLSQPKTPPSPLHQLTAALDELEKIL